MGKEIVKVNLKNKEEELPRVPATLIGWVHNTTDNVVRVAKSRGGKAVEKYKETEQEIVKALKDIKQKQS